MKCSLGISNFLEEISSLSHSIVFLYFFALIIEEGFLISLLFFRTLHSNGYIYPLLLCLSLLFFPQLFVSPPQTTTLPYCISFSPLPFTSLLSSTIFKASSDNHFAFLHFFFPLDGFGHRLLYSVMNQRNASGQETNWVS